MRTADHFYVSDLTRMCEDHDQQAMAMLAQTLDKATTVTNGDVALTVLAALQQDLANERAACVKQCGRLEDEQ